MTYRDNVNAILETNFIGFDKEYLDRVCSKICEMQTEKSYQDGLNDAWDCAKRLRHSAYDGALHDDEKKKNIWIYFIR